MDGGIKAHPVLVIQLIGVAACVEGGNRNDSYFTIVVAPISNSSGQRDDVSLTEVVDLLVLVSEPLASACHLLPLLFGLLERLECLWAARDHRS
ncbi:hypothetical protein BHE74_00042992, partial [Ensete ventricosum]